MNQYVFADVYSVQYIVHSCLAVYTVYSVQCDFYIFIFLMTLGSRNAVVYCGGLHLRTPAVQSTTKKGFPAAFS